ncbi:MAG: riboflavin kinase [Rikenellaceae bacterium]
MVVRGEVIKGRALGRKLGFPTANIAIEQSVDIENGVYISSISVSGVEYRAISNVGVKPTLGDGGRVLESHLLDFSGELYGQTIEVRLLSKLRDEQRFESVEALAEQVLRDIEQVKNLK